VTLSVPTVPTSIPGLRAFLRLSASQVQTFRDCQRKWSWHYVMGVREEEKPSQLVGLSVHDALENYLNGEGFDFSTETGYIAVSGIEHLPEPRTPGMRVEKEFHFVGPSGHSYLGYKDVQLPPSDGNPGVIIDHKTTSNLRWQKTAGDLITDVQATLYAVDHFREFSNEPEVELRWVYYLTKGARKSVVTRNPDGSPFFMNQEQAWDNFIRIEETAEQMAAVAHKHPLELPPNIEHCSAYGGCPHQGRCNLSPFDKMRSYTMNQNTLLAKLGKKPTNGAGAPPGAPVTNVVPITQPNSLLSRLQAGGIASTPVTTHVPTAPTPPISGLPAVARGPNALLGMLPGRSTTAPINPPEYQPPAPAAVGADTGEGEGEAPAPAWANAAVPDPMTGPTRFAPGLAIPNPNMFMPGGVAPGSSPVPPQAPPTAQPPAAVPVEYVVVQYESSVIDEKTKEPFRWHTKASPVEAAELVRRCNAGEMRHPESLGGNPWPPTKAWIAETAAAATTKPSTSKRGRPPKAAVAPATPAPSQAAAAAAQTSVLAGQPNPFAQPTPALGNTSSPIGVLYINCGPVGRDVLDANVLISAAKKTIASTPMKDDKGNMLTIADYRFAPFGQGPGMLALAVSAEVDNAEPDLAQCMSVLGVRLDTTTPEGSIVAVELTARAALVVR
jgi:PD-(D/E)XK nuclease superfamily